MPIAGFVPDSAPGQSKIAGFVPDKPAAPQGQPQGQPQSDEAVDVTKPLPSLRQDVYSVGQRVAKEQGVPFAAINSMLALESGGEVDPTHAHNPSGASGAMQLKPDTFTAINPKGNIYNLNDNVEAGTKYLSQLYKKYGNWVDAAGAYNMGPGDFDAYKAGVKTLSPETARYMAYVSAALTGSHELPLPHSKPVGTALPAPTQKGKNTDPTRAAHTWVDEASSQQSLPYILVNAKTRDDLEHTDGKYAREAWAMYQKDPAAADSIYGVNAKPMLDAYIAHGNPEQKWEAQYLKDHGWALATETAIEEFLNPMSIAEGGILGKIASPILKPAMKFLAPMYSPFGAILKKYGEGARDSIHEWAQSIKAGSGPAMKKVEEVFGGHGKAEMTEIIRLSQGLAPKITGPKAPILAQKAAKLRQHIVDATDKQLASGALKKNEVFNVKKYFPMGYGSYENPFYDPAGRDILKNLRQGRMAQPFEDPANPRLHKVHEDMDEALGSGLLSKDWSPADNLYRFLRRADNNSAFEDGLKKIAAKHPDLIRFSIGKMPQGIRNSKGTPMLRAADVVGHSDSPSLSKAWIAPEFGKFLEKRGSVLSGVAKWTDDPAAHAIEAAFDKFNGVMRGMIMYSPSFHPFWNIATNASAAQARTSFPRALMNYTKAVAAQALNVPEFLKAAEIPGGKFAAGVADRIEKSLWLGGHQFAADLADAVKAGAGSGISATGRGVLGGNPAYLRVTPFGELGSNMEKLDKFMTQIADWNTTATFGPRGEDQFVAKLFPKLTKDYGMTPEHAGWVIREALGNYANVDPNSWQSKFLFFYPWLKSNTPFWIKQFVHNPQMVSAYTESFKRQREVSGDPDAYDAEYPRGSQQAYLGRTGEGDDVRYTAPLPMKDAEHVSTMLDPRGMIPGASGALGQGPSFEQRLEAGKGLIQGRLGPVAGIVTDTISTMADSKAHDPGSYHGYTTMFDKDSPGGDQTKQLVAQTLERVMPLPFPFVSRELLKDGYTTERWPYYLTELAGAGTISYTQADIYKRTQAKARKALEKTYSHIENRQRGDDPLPGEDYEAARQKAWDHYKAVNDAILLQIKAKTGADLKRAAMKDFVPESGGSKIPGFTPDK